MFTQSPIRGDSPSSPNVTVRRGRRRTPNMSFSDSPLELSSPENSSFVTTRSSRNRPHRDFSFELDDLSEIIARSPQDMSISGPRSLNRSFSDSTSSSQYIDLDTPTRAPRRHRGVRRDDSADAYEHMFAMGDADRSREMPDAVELSEEEIAEENRRQLLLLQSNATFSLNEFDTEDKWVTLPAVDMRVDLDSTQIYDIDDIVEKPLRQFLADSSSNIAFKFHKQVLWMGLGRDSLADSVKNPAQIKYECLVENRVINETTVVTEDLYFQLRGIGFPTGVVSIHEIGALLRDDGRMYELVPSDKKLKSTVSFGYIHYLIPASDNCGPDNETTVYHIRVVRNAETGGKRKTKKSRNKHVRKTRKDRKRAIKKMRTTHK